MKLDTGMWGVTRGGNLNSIAMAERRVVEIEGCVRRRHGKEGFDYLTTEGRSYDENGRYLLTGGKHAFDIIRVFTSEQRARDWIEHRKQWRRFIRHFWPVAAALLLAAMILGGCKTQTTGPEEPPQVACDSVPSCRDGIK